MFHNRTAIIYFNENQHHNAFVLSFACSSYEDTTSQAKQQQQKTIMACSLSGLVCFYFLAGYFSSPHCVVQVKTGSYCTLGFQAAQFWQQLGQPLCSGVQRKRTQLLRIRPWPTLCAFCCESGQSECFSEAAPQRAWEIHVHYLSQLSITFRTFPWKMVTKFHSIPTCICFPWLGKWQHWFDDCSL